MQGTIQSDLIRGHINTIILKALFEGDRYGYDIIKEIEQKSGGQYILKQPTLYSCLKRLEVQGFVRAYWGAKTSGGRRKYFALTENGRELFIKNQSEWEYSRSVIDKLISDKDYDFSNVPLFTNADYESASSKLNDEELDEDVDIEKEFIDSGDESIDEGGSELLVASENITKTDNIYEGKDKNVAVQTQKLSDEDLVFLDPAQILHELFSRQNDKMSYLSKIEDEKININNDAVDSLTSDNYFKDFSSDIDEETAPFIAESEKEQAYIEKNIVDTFSSSNKFASDIEDKNDYFSGFTANKTDKIAEENFNSYQEEYKEDYKEDFIYSKNEAAKSKYEEPSKTKSAVDDFMSYDRTLNTNNKSDILDRTYKDVLATLVTAQFDAAGSEDEGFIETPPMIPESEEIKQSNEIYNNVEQMSQSTSSQPDYSQFKDPLNNSLNKLTEDTRNATGDNIKTRVHESGMANEYSTAYHFYSNKLMLVHFAILFGIMLLELAGVFLFVRYLYPVVEPNDLYNKAVFISALVLTIALPLYAALMNFIEPNKLKRIEFSLRTSITFRCIVAATLILITYLVNAFLNMPLSMHSDYLGTLLLPILFSLNFILSGYIFYLLYSSGKFSKGY